MKKNLLFVKSLASVLFILLSSTLSAETLSLDNCIEISLKQSEKIEAGKAAVEGASFEKYYYGMMMFPTAKVSGSYLFLKYIPEQESMAIPMGQMFGGLKQANPDLNVPQDLIGTTMTFPGAPDKQRTAEVSVTQPITPLWSAYNGYKGSQMFEEVEELKIKQNTEAISLKVAEYYYNYMMLKKMETLLDETDKQLDRYMQTAQNFVDAGMSDNRAVLKIKIEKAKVMKEKTNVSGMEDLIKTALSLLMNKEKDSFELQSSEADGRKVSENYKELLSLQEKNRSEFSMLEKNVKAYEILEKISYQGLIPTVALTAGYKKNWDSSSFQPEGVLYAGAVANWEIGFDWFKNYSYMKKAKANSVKVQLESVDSKKQMQLQIAKLNSELNVKSEEIKIAETEIEHAKENLRIEESKYNEKMTTETELLDAVIALNRAKTSLLTASYNYSAALWNMAKTIGVKIDDIAK